MWVKGGHVHVVGVTEEGDNMRVPGTWGSRVVVHKQEVPGNCLWKPHWKQNPSIRGAQSRLVLEGRTGLKGRGEKRMHEYRFSKKLDPSGVSQSVSNSLSPPGSQIASGMEEWFFVVVVTSLPSACDPEWPFPAWDFLAAIKVLGSNPELLGTLCQDSVATVTSQGNSREERTPWRSRSAGLSLWLENHTWILASLKGNPSQPGCRRGAWLMQLVSGLTLPGPPPPLDVVWRIH